MNKNACPTCGCELSNASFAEDGILCMWCGTINQIEGDPMLPDEPEDPGIDPPPSHLDGDPDEGGEPFDWEDHIGTNCPDDMYPDDGDGYYDTEGW